MREIGMALGVVESRVSQIHASAVLRLRSALSDLSSRRGRSGLRADRNAVKAPERMERKMQAGGPAPGVSANN